MTPVVLMSLASLWTFHPAGPQVDREVSRTEAGWRIEKTTSRFSGETACVIRRGDLAVRHGSLVLDLGKKTDVTNGRFRVDAGPVRKLEEGLLDVAGMHYPFFEEKETSPIRGKAALPLSYVSEASTVTVEPARRRARTFSLDGLNEAVGAAKSAGCSIPG